jgi:acylphosphatase
VSESADWQRREVHYLGRVQGVGFRYTAHQIAQGYPVTGFVKNLPDRRVYLVVEGPTTQVAEFLAEVAETMEHYISDTQETAAPAAHQFREFAIRF